MRKGNNHILISIPHSAPPSPPSPMSSTFLGALWMWLELWKALAAIVISFYLLTRAIIISSPVFSCLVNGFHSTFSLPRNRFLLLLLLLDQYFPLLLLLFHSLNFNLFVRRLPHCAFDRTRCALDRSTAYEPRHDGESENELMIGADRVSWICHAKSEWTHAQVLQVLLDRKRLLWMDRRSPSRPVLRVEIERNGTDM